MTNEQPEGVDPDLPSAEEHAQQEDATQIAGTGAALIPDELTPEPPSN